jgi:superoxide oxidase
MTRRALIIPLHWLLAFLMLAMIKGGSDAPALRWAYVATGSLWLILMAAGGPLGQPGPKLTGALRLIFRPFHLALYATLAATILLNILALTGRAADETAWTSLLVLLALASAHAIFHLWRHTALYDGALRMMMPKALHRFL